MPPEGETHAGQHPLHSRNSRRSVGPAAKPCAQSDGWIAIHGVMVSYVGLFDSVPRNVALVLMAAQAFVMAVLMWRSGAPGYAARASVPEGPVTA